MRTDITIDKKQVRLPLNGQIGYQKYKAQFGDVIFFKEGDRVLVGRMIGRIANGRDLGTGQSLKDWIVTICLGSTLSFAMERWVKPDDVCECYAPDSLDLSARLAYFFNGDWLKLSTDTLRGKANAGDFFPSTTL